MAHSPIPPARLLQHTQDALVVVGPDLIIQHVANASAPAFSLLHAPDDALLGRPVAEALCPLFAPFERAALLEQLRKAFDPAGSDLIRYTLEGAAPVAVRAAGLTPFFDVSVRRYVDDDGVLLAVSLRDASDRLQLRRALERVRDERDIALAVLRSDPAAMHAFLRSALDTLTLVQSLQRLPTRQADAFSRKLKRIAEELEPLGAGAGKLGLDCLARSTRGLLAELHSVMTDSPPSGDRFLPLAAAIDGLFQQLVIASQALELREAATQPDSDTPHATAESAWPAVLSVKLAQCIETATQDSGHRAALTLSGLEILPSMYHRSLEPLLLQLVGNAVTQGLDSAAEREAAAKPAIGQVSISCHLLPQAGYEILVADDGRGVEIGDVPFLQDVVMRLGGSIGVSSSRGRYTRLRIQLPAEPAAGADQD